jgi:hypothetical protein
METIGATLAYVTDGEVHIALPFSKTLSQQHVQHDLRAAPSHPLRTFQYVIQHDSKSHYRPT